MSIDCQVSLKVNATGEQLTKLGSALWRWCARTAGDTGSFPHLDNQIVADLIAGKPPASHQTPGQSEARSGGVHFSMRDVGCHDRWGTIDRLRWEIPAEGVEDILVDGTSWKPIELER